MPLIDYPAWAELDEATGQLLSGMRDPHGGVSAFARMLAHHPEVLNAAVQQFGTVMFGGRLDPALKQLAFVTVSQQRGTAYCAATHGSELVDTFGLPSSVLEALAVGDDTALTDRQRAVAQVARQAAIDPKGVGSAHLDALRTAGLDEPDIVELVAVLAQAAFATTVADMMDLAPGDQSPELERYLVSVDRPATSGRGR